MKSKLTLFMFYWVANKMGCEYSCMLTLKIILLILLPETFFTELIYANLILLADTNDPKMFYVLKWGY